MDQAQILNEGKCAHPNGLCKCMYILKIYFFRPVPSPDKKTITTNQPGSATKGGKNRKKINLPNSKGLSSKKEKLYCVCRTPYDDTK